MNKPKRCKECRHLGDYTSGVWSRNPHYCCELIWRLFEEDHKVNPDTVDSRCPLNDERIESYRYEDIKALLKTFLMNQYDIRPSLAEKTIEEMFKRGVDFISKEEQKPPKVTYGDMIRKMNDDELAAFIFSIHEDESSDAKYFNYKQFDFGLIYEIEDFAEKLGEFSV